jgi:hypothetical protein
MRNGIEDNAGQLGFKLAVAADAGGCGTSTVSSGCVGSPTLERSMRMEHGHIVETAVEARAGFLGRPVLVVLVLSTALAIIAFSMTYLGVK